MVEASYQLSGKSCKKYFLLIVTHLTKGYDIMQINPGYIKNKIEGLKGSSINLNCVIAVKLCNQHLHCTVSKQ